MPARPRLIPVLDVMNGRAVRAVGGRREAYRPLMSRLSDTAAPRTVAEALLRTTGAEEVYVADLDAITTGRPARAVRELVAGTGCRVLLDAGGSGPTPHVREVLSLEARLTEGRYREHARSPGAVFSVDLFEGRLVEGWQRWGLDSAWSILELVKITYGFGYRSFIVLDTASVGRADGVRTHDLLRTIRHGHPDVELIAGGGVRGWSDVDRLGEAGADAVLVASALHDGTLTFPRPAS